MSHKKMNPEVKKVWINELRSGRYKQTTARLHGANGGYCCLGVLCDLSGAMDWHVGDPCIPPTMIQRWAGLSALSRERLIVLNDEKGASFGEIANWIERYL